ncbi:MAG: hypothetical protein Q7U54_17755 [Bacteroidales bacterium]|nr:hypothetical protein [Bacteroidales bacterium]
MHTIRLKVNDKIYEKLLWLLSKFGKDEIEIIVENSTFSNDQKYLEKELNEILSGEAKFIGVEEAEEQLTQITENR